MFTPWEELSKVEQLASTYYDYYKDVHGIRPRWIYEANEHGEAVCIYSEQEMLDMLDRLAKEAEVVFAEEAEREAEAIKEFESNVAIVIANGAKDRATALRWIFDAEDDGGAMDRDLDYLCFNFGLPYGYFKNEVIA